jgi:hypothetical protein
MRRNVKVKALSTRLPVRKTGKSASASPRRAYPAWIDAEEGMAIALPAVTKHLRAALVLRTVSKRKSANPRSSTDDPGVR